MKLIEFASTYPDEASCRLAFRALREKQGIVCPKCGGRDHYWKQDRESWECKHCKKRVSLRSGTLLHYSKLPFRYWFIALHLLSSTKKSFSALEIQRQLDHKYYEAIWTMVHKIRTAMGQRDDRVVLEGEVEIDEGFFSSFSVGDDAPTDVSMGIVSSDNLIDKEQTGVKKNKRGRGSLKKSTVLVMVESSIAEAPVDSKKKPKHPRKAGRVKMVVIPDTTIETINLTVGKYVDNNAVATTDGNPSYNKLNEEIEKCTQIVAKGAESCKVLPWVHICISNAKRWFLAIKHATSSDYLQNYLDEFSYNFNRRYTQEVLFERLLVATIGQKNNFKPNFR